MSVALRRRMPRLPRRLQRAEFYHVLNRANVRARLFTTPSDYQVFVDLLAETVERFQLPLLAYCVMPNHWHLVVTPLTQSNLSTSLHWLTGTHAVRWSHAHVRRGPGHVYQDRFRSIPVQPGINLWRVVRYVERNACSARLVRRAEDWPWCSARQRLQNCHKPRLAPLHFLPSDLWLRYLNQQEPDRDIADAIRRDRPVGDDAWQQRRREELGLPEPRPPGRPRLEK